MSRRLNNIVKSRQCVVLLLIPCVVLIMYSMIYLKHTSACFGVIDTETGPPINSTRASQVDIKNQSGLKMVVQDGASLGIGKEYVIPRNVLYIWCGSGRYFEFRHYLGVLGIIKYIQPDNIYFVFDAGEPEEDKPRHYYTWFAEFSDIYPFLHKEKESKACKDKKPNDAFVDEWLNKNGGMFIHENVIFASFDKKLLTYKTVNASDKSGLTLVKMTSKSSSGDVKTLSCAHHSEYNSSKSDCVVMDKVIFPRDIWEKDDRLHSELRTLMYGKPDVIRARQSYNDLVPNIAHIVWVGGGNMDFLFYLDVLSLIYIAKIDMVYIHGDAPPKGFYWDLLKHEKQIELVHRTRTPVYGVNVSPMHTSDVWRVDIMTKYGGMYVDNDVIFVRPLTEEIRSYDAVASRDIDTNAPYPERYNYGVSLGKRGAKYWHLFQQTMQGFVDSQHTYNGLEKPYKIKERYPELLHTDHRLQVICHFYKCRPSWMPGFQDPAVNHLTTKCIQNWTQDAFAYHWTYPTPPELGSHQALLTSATTMFTEMGIYVLEQAGMLNSFQQQIRKQ